MADSRKQTDPRKLRPSELCRLLNSTPLGEVIDYRRLRDHRMRAGHRIGSDQHVDLVRYVAWLLQMRHTAKADAADHAGEGPELAETVEEAVALCWQEPSPEDLMSDETMTSDENELTLKQQTTLAALLTESSNAAAATKAGISESTLYRWLRQPQFRAARQRAGSELVLSAYYRLQAGAGMVVDALVAMAHKGRREGDRIRAGEIVCKIIFRNLLNAGPLAGDQGRADSQPLAASDIVAILAAQLRQVAQSELPTAEKARLIAILADANLRALNVEAMDKRLQALETILIARKGDMQP